MVYGVPALAAPISSIALQVTLRLAAAGDGPSLRGILAGDPLAEEMLRHAWRRLVSDPGMAAEVSVEVEYPPGGRAR